MAQPAAQSVNARYGGADVAWTSDQWRRFAQAVEDGARRGQAPIGADLVEIYQFARQVHRLWIDVRAPCGGLGQPPADELARDVAQRVGVSMARLWDGAPSEAQAHCQHSLWFRDWSDPNCVVLRGVWPLRGVPSRQQARQVAEFVIDDLQEGYKGYVKLDGYDGRLPVVHTGASNLVYWREQDGAGVEVADFRQKYRGRGCRPPWREDGSGWPDKVAVISYGTVMNWAGAPHQPEFKAFGNNMVRFRARVQDRAVATEADPLLDYFRQADTRDAAAIVDMRDHKELWDGQTSIAFVGVKLVQCNFEPPFKEAVDYLNRRCVVCVQGGRRRMYVKRKIRDKDLEMYHVDLERVEDPEQWFRSYGGDALWVHKTADRVLFPNLSEKKRAAGYNFFDWYLRHHRGVRMVEEVVFRPLQPGEMLNPSVLNTWQGLLCYEWGTTPDRRQALHQQINPDSHLRVILDHVKAIFCRGDEDLAKEVHQMIAHVLRRPMDKINRGPVFNGPEGTGKSMFFVDFIGKRLMGPMRHWIVTYKADDIVGKWNDHAERCLFIFLEEAEMGHSNRANTAQLQQMITADMEMIHERYQNNRAAYSFYNIMLFTNYKNPLSVNLTNRRFPFFPCDPSPIYWTREENVRYFSRLAEAFEEGAKDYWNYLLTLDLGDWDKHARPTQSLYTVEQGIHSLRWRPDMNSVYWMFEKIKVKDFGFGTLVYIKDTLKTKDKDGKEHEKELWGELTADEASWASGFKVASGAVHEVYVRCTVQEAYDNYCARQQTKQSLEAFKDTIESHFHPEQLPNNVWRFGTLECMEQMFESIVPTASGFTFERYRKYLEEERTMKMQQAAKRGAITNDVHRRAEKRQRQQQRTPAAAVMKTVTVDPTHIINENTMGGSNME